MKLHMDQQMILSSCEKREMVGMRVHKYVSESKVPRYEIKHGNKGKR
jgi:hypothetical protein